MTAKMDPNVIFVIDPRAAKRVLSEHELNPCTTTKCSKEENDKSSTGVNDDLNGYNHSIDANYANLLKPTKPTILLKDALTNANGCTWHRQRHCVSRAFAVGKELKSDCGQYAAEKMMELLQQEVNSLREHQRLVGYLSFQVVCAWTFCCHHGRRRYWNCASKEQKPIGIYDIRLLAREVAIYAVLRMVFGHEEEKIGNRKEVLEVLRDMIGDNLKLRRDEEFSIDSKLCVEKLDGLVRGILEKLSMNNLHLVGDGDHDRGGEKDSDEDEDEDSHYDCNGINKYSCLAERLLAYEKKQNNYLTRDEIVSNVHSALLAGVQTISTTITGSFAHLADNPSYQKDLRSGLISGRDVVIETLRILPPVAGLPRYSESAAFEICGEDNKKQCRIEKGHRVVIDLLAFAHAHDTCDEDSKGEEGYCAFSSLQFKPFKRNRKLLEQPWGIGKRKCPAGAISVECISSILEHVLRNENITCHFASKKEYSCLDRGQVGGWMESITYEPTLCFNSPIKVIFESHDDIL
eukprot:CAMPEP_0176478860 /NCGR_PEP_ID=MMETSP0200_2-20121128/1415_1 /TAXON_ID=947934 /ORGANISM="Chaetoceros sp., Strain GSL56" /LENGTH=518 /DNA_ID=CAMNT_0017874833 /DNA_START=103 /DNA_END=1659 /DNA_ORIENTATION=+